MMMMQMTFYNSIKSTILFDDWKTKTGAQYFGALVLVALLGLLLEFITAVA